MTALAHYPSLSVGPQGRVDIHTVSLAAVSAAADCPTSLDMLAEFRREPPQPLLQRPLPVAERLNVDGCQLFFAESD
jgi:hypothetical protein